MEAGWAQHGRHVAAGRKHKPTLSRLEQAGTALHRQNVLPLGTQLKLRRDLERARAKLGGAGKKRLAKKRKNNTSS